MNNIFKIDCPRTMKKIPSTFVPGTVIEENIARPTMSC